MPVDPAVNGHLEALEKRVGAIEAKVDQSNEKLDQVLAAVGPITKWVQAQSAKDAKQTQTEKEAYVWVASRYGEYAFMRGAGNVLLAYYANEWRQCYIPYGNGALYVISGNSYCGVGYATEVYNTLK